MMNWKRLLPRRPVAQPEQIAELERQVRRLTHLTIDRAEVAQLSDAADSYRGNPYVNYEQQVNELVKKFKGQATWGNEVTQNVVNVRSSFTIGSGVRAVKVGEDGEREMAFVKAFMAHNGLDGEVAQSWVQEAELEGKFLAKIVATDRIAKMNSDSPVAGIIEARFVSWTEHHYKIQTAPDDYTEYEKATYEIVSMNRMVTLLPPEFVFKKFGGRTNDVNDTPPRLGPVLRNLEDLDKALFDWRKINNLFASPTPHMNCDSQEEAKQLYADLRNINWKVGKLICTSGVDFKMVEAQSGRGIESLEHEITTNAKFISGASGVPVHFLGLPDLLSNRATADNLLELVVASTARERRIWIGFYTELFRKALAMANENFQAGFNVDSIVADVPFVSADKMKQLVEVWLPLYEGSVIDLDTIISRIPEIDTDEVKRKLEERKQREMDEMAALAIPGVPGGGNNGNRNGNENSNSNRRAAANAR